MLREHAPGLWSAEASMRVGGLIPLGTRMTAIRLGDGGLVLHSPIALSPELRSELDARGPVRFLVAPNRLHYLFLAAAAEAYPDARRLGAPGLAEKRRDLALQGVLGEPAPPLGEPAPPLGEPAPPLGEPAPPLGEPAPPEWKGELETHLVQGIPYANEVVLWHRPTRSLVVTDLVFNVQQADSRLYRAFLRLNGAYRHFGPSRMLRSLVRDRAALRRSIDHLLAWDFDRVLVSHGEVLERGGRDALREAFAWL